MKRPLTTLAETQRKRRSWSHEKRQASVINRGDSRRQAQAWQQREMKSEEQTHVSIKGQHRKS